MKIVAINGSPTGIQGATGKVLAALLEGAQEQGAEVQLFELGAGTVKPCISCHTCQKSGHCVIEDDLQPIQKAMRESDGIVLGSPNYIDDVSAQLKALLDRCFSMFHCQTLNGKYGASVVTSGGPNYQRIEQYLLEKIGTIGCWKVGSMVAAGGLIHDPEYAPAIKEDARELGRKLAHAIATQTTYPEQIDARDECFEVMRWLVESQKEAWPAEYEYWQKHWKDTVIKSE